MANGKGGWTNGFHTFVPAKDQTKNSNCLVCGAPYSAGQHASPPAIRFTVSMEGEEWQRGRKRSTRRILKMYIWGADFEFKSGVGQRLKRFHFSPDKNKATGFGKITAEEIVKQLTDGSFGRRYFGLKIEPREGAE